MKNWVPRSLLVRATTHRWSLYIDWNRELWSRVDQKNRGNIIFLSKWLSRPHNLLVVTIPYTIFPNTILFPKNHRFPNCLQLLVSIVSSKERSSWSPRWALFYSELSCYHASAYHQLHCHPSLSNLCCCFLHINRSGLNHTQYYTWLPIRYVVCWTERDQRNIYQAPMRAKEERNKNSKIFRQSGTVLSCSTWYGSLRSMLL